MLGICGQSKAAEENQRKEEQGRAGLADHSTPHRKGGNVGPVGNSPAYGSELNGQFPTFRAQLQVLFWVCAKMEQTA